MKTIPVGWTHIVIAVTLFSPGLMSCCEAEAQFSTATDALTNVIASKPLCLSVPGQPEDNVFSFSALFSNFPRDGQIAQFAPTEFDVVADGGKVVILIQTAEGLPYALIEEGQCIVVDTDSLGGFLYRDGGTSLFRFISHRKGEGDTIDFRCAFLGVHQRPQVDFDLKVLLQRLLEEGTNFSYDARNQTIHAATATGSRFEVALSKGVDGRWFGVERLGLKGDSRQVVVSDIGNESPLRGLIGVSKRDVEKMGLPLHVLTDDQLSGVSMIIPVGFPENDKQKLAAEKLHDWIAMHLAEPIPAVPRPDPVATKEDATNGNAAAERNLGIAYLKGDGVKQDYKEASRWFRKAAVGGDAEAQYNLGILYTEGLGVSQNYSQATKWYTRAAEQNYSEAEVNLGMMYFDGQGVPQDYRQARRLFERAAGTGSAMVALRYLGVMHLKGLGVPASTNEAIQWFRKAADCGSGWAQTELGNRYANGDGVEPDAAEALQWLRKAADRGYAQAQLNLGKMLLQGLGVATNKAEGIKWIRLAADQGNAVAQLTLGSCFIIGEGVQTDPIEGFKWIALAAQQGEPRAVEALNQSSKELDPHMLAEAKEKAADFTARPIAFPDE